MTQISLSAGQLTLDQLRDVFFKGVELTLSEDVWAQVAASRAMVKNTVASGDVVYGINTGFGRLAQSHIDVDALAELQHNLVVSHATGVGNTLDNAVVRLVLLLKINALAQGYSGIRTELLELLVALLNQDVLPAIPEKGSVGASGDLAPLAHMSLPLIGLGKVSVQGEWLDAREGFKRAGLKPLTLTAKEGLALLNGTQVSTALALSGLFQAEQNASAAFVAGSLTVEAALGSRVPFDARIHKVRGQRGQEYAAHVYSDLLTSSEIQASHHACDKVQDPYSLRCQPQVMGACLDQMQHAAQILTREANAVSDNPLLFVESGDALSGGNFHAQPVAFVADNLALAIAEIGAMSERRMALLLDSGMSQLPPFLVEDAGLNSGFMIAQVTSAALASENKSLAHPASVDSLPTSANQEDHVSMATFAARRLNDMNLNTRYIVAIELLAACQGIELRRPLRSNELLENYWQTVREVAAYWDQDRVFQPDMEAVEALIRHNAFGSFASDFTSQRAQ